jgi:hypothetical protein
MLIETDDWTTLSQASKETGIPQAVFYRTAHRIGVTVELFEKWFILKADVPKVVSAHRGVGNPRWIEDPMEASRNGVRAAKLSLKARGLTPLSKRKTTTSAHAVSGKRGRGA